MDRDIVVADPLSRVMKPYNAYKQERKEGEDSQVHSELLLPMSIVVSEIYDVHRIYG